MWGPAEFESSSSCSQFWGRVVVDFGLGLELGESDGSSVRLEPDPDSGTSKSTICSRSGQLFGTDFGLGLESAGRNLGPHESECGRNFSGPDPGKGPGLGIVLEKNEVDKSVHIFHLCSPKSMEMDREDRNLGERFPHGGKLMDPFAEPIAEECCDFGKSEGWG